MSEDVLVRTRRGRIHRATLTESGALRYDERCNLDDSEGEEIVGSDALANAEPGQLCEHDFPDIPAPAEDAA